ncbi:MAG: putative gas vesicle protein [Actinoallomurus sp.]|nr:putative gas vesicle protein [Actinoallomurus sp.]
MPGGSGPAVPQPYGGGQVSSPGSGSLGDILERVLDKGIVIAGDIRVNLLDIELLTIKLRLLVVSVETARELGIDWWEKDAWLSSNQRELEEENERLRDRLAALEEGDGARRTVAGPEKKPAGERSNRSRGRHG